MMPIGGLKAITHISQNEFDAIEREATRRGWSKSALIYNALRRITHDFTDFSAIPSQSTRDMLVRRSKEAEHA